MKFTLCNNLKSQLIVNSSYETVSFVLCVDVLCLQDFDLLSICTGGKESSRCLYLGTHSANVHMSSDLPTQHQLNSIKNHPILT